MEAHLLSYPEDPFRNLPLAATDSGLRACKLLFIFVTTVHFTGQSSHPSLCLSHMKLTLQVHHLNFAPLFVESVTGLVTGGLLHARGHPTHAHEKQSSRGRAPYLFQEKSLALNSVLLQFWNQLLQILSLKFSCLQEESFPLQVAHNCALRMQVWNE